ncbi:MAG: hypothetical protein ACKPKO_48000 [Candidatus Fonsibacter sp.]
MSFSIGDLRFIDSFAFMASSLDSFVSNLYDDSDKFINFQFMRNYVPEHMELLCRNGFYLYEWVDDIEKLNHVGLPEKESFYSTLKQ